jgi:hypothetical protein
MRRLALFVIALVCACSRTPGDAPKPNGNGSGNGNGNAGSKPGAVTVHFQNDTKTDVFVEAPAIDVLDIKSGERGLPRGHFCQDVCGPQCVCKRCGEAPPMVAVVPAGGSIDVTWTGDFYVDGTCKQGSESCGCGEQNFLSSGPVTITLRARRATKPAKPATVTSGTFNADLDDASPTCTAKADVVVSEKPQTVSATFACDG